MIAGTHSGCGKTTLTLSLLRLLSNQGMEVTPFKTGPDYIDGKWLGLAARRHCGNLDPVLSGPAAFAPLADVSGLAVVEGVMGFYDGRGATTEGSSYDVAVRTKTPVILVVDGTGTGTSLAAVVHGFASWKKNAGIRGVLASRVRSERHEALIREAVQGEGVCYLGGLPRDPELRIGGRHLGLVMPEDVEDADARMERGARLLQDHLDMDALLRVAEAPDLSIRRPRVPWSGRRIGVAMDEAFCFYYEENLNRIRAYGELVPFSPIHDARMPDNLDALYLGGGYPELFARELSGNWGMREHVRTQLELGMPCFAECGGFLYLCRELDGQEMTGFFPIRAYMTDRLQNFGYTVLHGGGLSVPAHEFHHAKEELLAPIQTAYEGERSRYYRKENTVAGFPHIAFLGHEDMMIRLLSGG